MSCREYPAYKVGLTKSDRRMFTACHIIAAYLQQKLKLFQAQGIIRPVFTIRT